MMSKLFENRHAKYIVGIAVCILFMLLSGPVFGAFLGIGGLQREYNAQLTDIRELTNQIETKRTDSNQQHQSVATQVTGVDLARVDKDNEIAKTLISKVTTWTSQTEYDNLRNEMMTTYHLGANDRFMTAFLPQNDKIDEAQLNCHYSGMKAIVSGINGGTYSYFTIVTASGSSGGASAKFSFVMMYDITAGGEIQNLSGYTLS